MRISTPTVWWILGISSCSHRLSVRINLSFDLDGNKSVDFPDFILFAKRFGEGAPEEEIAVTLPGGANLEMVWIQPGRFLMGSPDSELGRYDDEGPQHQVTITKGFYLGKYEVTRAQWEGVMNTRPWAWAGTFEDPEKAKYPAVNLAWQDVETFIRRLNESEGKEFFRLPTEAEWEYACRAGTTTRWSFGEDSTRIADYARYNENSRAVIVRDDGSIAYGSPEAQETGSVFPNPWGLYDMHGTHVSGCWTSMVRIRHNPKLIPRGRSGQLKDTHRKIATSKEGEGTTTAPDRYGLLSVIVVWGKVSSLVFECSGNTDKR